MIKDTSFEKIKKYRKISDCFDRSSLECNIAFYGAFLFCVILYVMIKNSEISSINNMFVTMTKDVSIALIGFLGFTVSGLAILTGVISQKVVQKISQVNKRERLEKILLSFYLLGIVIAFTILGLLFAYIFSLSDLYYNIGVVLILAFIFAYLVIFILFYSVKLIGNCLEIFFIVNSDEEIGESNSLKQIYNAYRLTALESVCLKHVGADGVNEYKRIVKEEVDLSTKHKEDLLDMYKEHFNEK